MTESKICTCPSGDGSLRWPCPAHPAEQAGGDERAAFELFVRKHCGMPEHIAVNWDAKFTNDAWEGWQARAALAQPSPVRSSLLINGYQLRAALDFIAPDGTAEQLESEACIEWRQQDADFLEAGLYAFCAEYPEEGGVLLDEEPTTAQPSPLQSEQAEAERPEVVAYRTIGRHTKHQHPHYALNYYKQNAEDQAAHWRERGCEVSEDELMTVAQHERIVGALRAENAKLSEALDRWPLIRDSLKLRLADALARVAELELKLDKSDYAYDNDRIHMRGLAARAIARAKVFDDGSDGADAESARSVVAILRELLAVGPAQAQHSVPEEFSFEYRHPNGESHTVTVSRDQVINEMPDFLFEALCSKFCNCEPVGETNVVECCCDEYAEEFKLLAAAPGKEVGHE
ncbi:TPA: hypothetical protein SL485_000655 [Pseudomonas aeruginosa]|nr:hypothetical protein [Pseudomonas aeruginosa]HEJ3988013.1 hypothetical protein [Pseudomonas aeruginosa]